MEKSRILKPNMFFAAIFQFFELMLYLGIGVLCYKIITFFVGFDILSFIWDTLNHLDIESLTLLMEFMQDNAESYFIGIMTVLIILFTGMANKSISIADDNMILKEGFIKVDSRKFLKDEIKRYEIIKDLGFLNSGTVLIMTEYGDRIEIPYIVDIKKAKQALDAFLLSQEPNGTKRSQILSRK